MTATGEPRSKEARRLRNLVGARVPQLAVGLRLPTFRAGGRDHLKPVEQALVLLDRLGARRPVWAGA